MKAETSFRVARQVGLNPIILLVCVIRAVDEICVVVVDQKGEEELCPVEAVLVTFHGVRIFAKILGELFSDIRIVATKMNTSLPQSIQKTGLWVISLEQELCPVRCLGLLLHG